MKKFAPYAGWMAFFFAFAALFFYIIAPNEITLVGSLGGIALVNLILFVLLDWTLIQRGLRGRAARYGTNTVVLSAIFLGILVFANLISHRHKHRFDITEEGYYTLAPQTRKIISTLPRKVKLTAFFQTETPGKDEFQNLIEGYLELTDQIELKFIDPDKNPAITKQYGVTTYGTVAFESGKQETKVKAVTEESLTNALLKVIRDEEKTIYFLDGHGEKNIDAMDNEGYSTTKSALEKSGYKVKKLLLLQSGAIPENADLVVINGPDKPVLEKEIKVLEGYLNKGGSLFILVDPKTKSGLDGFLKGWGIKLVDDIIIDPFSKLFGGDYAAPVISKYAPHDITKEFVLATIFPVLRSVSAQKVEGIESTELLHSGDGSWAETDFTSDKVKYDADIDRKGPVPVAVVATRDLNTDKKENEANQENPDPLNGKTKKKTSLVVVGDSDFANNQYFNFSGNGDFFLNVASWLVQEENLISIRPRERKSNPVQMNREQGSTIFLFSVIVFPAIILGAGIRVWWRRRGL